ncbi:MAG: WD40/YVTN/BNR-like repeat-containing protein, partial [Nocardioidaceae bacterium]
ILPHPTDPDSITAAMSSGGVYQTEDGGKTWTSRNTGVQAEFLPEGQQYPEFGQCVHKIARHPSAPDRLFMQNHGGVYRSDDHAATWTSIEKGLPANFGFPMVVHPHEPQTIYTFPLQGSGGRYPVDAAAKVWRSPDGGDSWQPLHHGLPDNFFVGVMRDAMGADDHESAGIYFGARNGSVYASPDSGDSWAEIRSGLPDVMAVRAASF